jgi:hypothetical protein
MARKTKYKSQYADELVEYFMRFIEMRDDPKIDDAAERKGMVPIVIDSKGATITNPPCSGYPSLVKFAIKIGVTPQTLVNWRNTYKAFDEACEFADLIQDEVLNERALSGMVDGKVAMKIRELKANAKLKDANEVGAKVIIKLNDDPDEQKIEIKKWVGEINEDTEY